MDENLYTMQHGHWVTTIDYIGGNHPYRVTTASELSVRQPQTFCPTIEHAKKAAARHMEEVKK